MKILHKIAFILLIIGGLNWLVAGIANGDIGLLFGDVGNIAARVIYILVGLAAVFELLTHKKNCKECDGNSSIVEKSF